MHPEWSLYIGVGNRYRQDDGVGVYIAEELKKHYPNVKLSSGSGFELNDLWQGWESVVLFDAVNSDKPAGHIFEFTEQKAVEFFNKQPTSSHSFGILESLKMARQLNQVPEKIKIYGIVGEQFGHGEGLSSSVRKASDKLVEQIRNKS